MKTIIIGSPTLSRSGGIGLKRAVRVLGADYQKVYDVITVLHKIAKQKLGISGDNLQQTIRISQWFNEIRATSFYIERDYQEADAKRACGDAQLY